MTNWDICAGPECGAAICLVQTGARTYKWLTDPRDKQSWRCGSDPAFPVRSHAPEWAHRS